MGYCGGLNSQIKSKVGHLAFNKVQLRVFIGAAFSLRSLELTGLQSACTSVALGLTGSQAAVCWRIIVILLYTEIKRSE